MSSLPSGSELDVSLQTWWLFAAAVFLLSGTPGPNMLHIMRKSAEVGFRASVPAMLGCLSALMSVLVLSAIGLAAAFAAVPAVFDVLRYAGIVYLIYLGVKAWRADVGPMHFTEGRPPSLGPWKLYRGGFLVGITNPKLIIFATAFLPQFINGAAPQTVQFVILLTTYGAIELGWYVVYAIGGSSLARSLQRPSWRRVFNRISGSIFVGFGLMLFEARA
ncbi:Amino acid transporter [Beijerinckiaceae bacterium RH AL1]|nr:Amino acid transporter [Beijerinckiaceae bacterium RH CH11]VVB44685.1 Amino acid transporter [Beijerinckiaceae bacterium RH AL8]VVC54443.1 Amino acid transporter [Beijerinckiaceae bacterium RH AL1]